MDFAIFSLMVLLIDLYEWVVTELLPQKPIKPLDSLGEKSILPAA